MFSFDKEAVLRHFNWELGLRLSRAAFRLQSLNQVDQPLRNIISGSNGLMGTMPINITEGEYAGFGVKSVVVRFDVTGKKPSHFGCVLVYDEKGTSGIAAVDAAAITEIRTASASAYATSLLAPESASRLAIIGTGVQARAHLEAMLHVRPITDVSIWGRSAQHCATFAAWCEERFDVAVSVKQSPGEAMKCSDIICTTTAARAAFMRREDLPATCHINAVGASAPGFQEFDEGVYDHTRLFTDSNHAVLASAQCVINAVKRGFLPAADVGVEIGSVAQENGACGDDITIFRSVGLAVQDMVFARELVRRVIASV